jgi:hypothetical protein
VTYTSVLLLLLLLLFFQLALFFCVSAVSELGAWRQDDFLAFIFLPPFLWLPERVCVFGLLPLQLRLAVFV